MKLDLTKILLVVVLLTTTTFGVRQCSDKNTYKKAYNEKLVECATYESDIINYHKAKEAKIRDSLNYYKKLAGTYYQSAKSKNSVIGSYKAHIETLSDSISKLLPKQSKDYIDANFVPGGDDYDITADQLMGIHVSDLKRKECEKLAYEQGVKIDLLDKAVNECMSGYDLASKSLTECQTEGAKKDIKIKNLKRKNFNRTLFGVIMGGLAVVAVL